ncbi:MAG: FAD-binding oxidoreductase [Gammaproteobacteria bacterium]|jgi:4-cresol dehydrogenase (hydroxylating)|nr:FAD-binding oxidoreductase [Gammaproteobacteria bacterium]MBT6043920.1 FAD-binding oxidoreductase [Gammaproteobacteria bacterium]
MAVLPPNTSEADFNNALQAFAAAVGDEWVFSSDEDLKPFRDHYSPVPLEEDELLASAAVAPANVEEVQAVVKVANQYLIPLYPISTGKNFAYGGPAPNVRGSVVLDLKRMDRIIEVNEERNFALVEPGVSYMDLYTYIQERGLKVWLDCPDPGWGSPVGNTLDRGIGYTLGFYRDHNAAQYGLEAVLANGDVIRTGMGALPGSDTWQEYKYGFGPDPAGMFSQGNYGIVTKMGIRLMPQPAHYRNGLVTVPLREDLGPLVNSINYLNDLNMIGDPWYGSPLRALLDNADFRAAATRRGGGIAEELNRFAREANLHSWQVELQFYGSERTTEANWEYAQEVISDRIPGARFTAGESLAIPLTPEQLHETTGPYSSNMRRNITQGVPGLGIWKNLGRTQSLPDTWAQGHLGLFAVLPRSAESIFEAQQVFADTMADLNLDGGINALSLGVNWYQYAFLFSAGFSTGGGNADNSPAGKKKIADGLKALLVVAGEHGWGEYRAAPYFQDAVSEQYSFNDYSLRRFNETIKDAVDPNGILAPGRGGIWPGKSRG